LTLDQLEMSANEVWLTPTTRVPCSNAAKTQFEGCPKLANRSQPLVGRSSPYCEDMWICGETLLFNKFFSDCQHVPVAKI